MTAPHIMVIGDINIDAIIAASEYPPEGGEAVVDRTDFRLGGSGCNTSVILAKLGAKATHVGNLGTEPLGQMALGYIHSAGIDTGLLQQKDEFQTGFFFILITSGGQRTMFGGRACNAIPPDYDQVAPYLPSMDALHLSGYTLIRDEQFEVIQKLAQLAHQQGKVISLDPGICTTKIAKAKVNAILPCVDYVLISQQELADYSTPDPAEAGIKELLERGLKALVIKMGANGSRFIDSRHQFSRPAFHSERHSIQDTTGAGDCFDAGFLYGLMSDLNLADCLTLGNLTAYRTIIALHGMADICQTKNYTEGLLDLLDDCSLPADRSPALSDFLKSRSSG